MKTTQKTILLATACALFAAPAFAQSNMSATPNYKAGASSSMSSSSTSSMNAGETTGAAPSDQQALSTQDFVNKAAITNMFEIQAGKLAEQKAKSQQDKTFAKKMVSDHQAAENKLKSLVNGSKVTAQLPTALDSAHQDKLEQLKKLSGAQFDQTYDQIQKAGHRDAVSMFRNYAQNGGNAQLKQWAKKTLPTLQTHLSMAQKLKG